MLALTLYYIIFVCFSTLAFGFHKVPGKLIYHHRSVQSINPPIPIARHNPFKEGSLVLRATSKALETTLKTVGPLIYIGIQGTSLKTAWRIIKKKSAKEFSPVQFFSLFINSLIWTVYGVMKKDISLMIPNLSGVFVGILCVIAYQLNATVSLWKNYAVVTGLAALLGGLTKFNMVNSVGLLGCLLSIVLAASPLSVIKTVIEKKSTASLPFPTSFATWLNGLSWGLYGLLVVNDPLVYLPNAVGLMLATVQLSLFAKYGFK